MKLKILKLEVITLFLMAAITNYVFLASDLLPDNFLRISSVSSYNFLSYYLASILSYLNYYSGPWILVLFALHLVGYIFFLSRNADIYNVLVIFPLAALVSFSLFFMRPSLLGFGYYQFLQSNLSVFGMIGLIVISALTVIICMARMKLFSFSMRDRLAGFLLEVKNFARLRQEIKGKDKCEQGDANLSCDDHLSNLNPRSEIVEDQALLEMTSPDVESFILPNSEDALVVASSFDKAIVRESISEEKYYDLISAMPEKKAEQKFSHPDEKYFQDIINKIHSKLSEFRIEGRIINILKGPVVDTFEWELGIGEKISKLTSAAEDLTLALLGAPIRMVYPMRGRGTVGIEVPRNPREIIFLDEIISSKEFTSTTHQLPLAMGKDAFGEAVVVDLAAMPHMLVAGATGAGKSVFINSILVSLLIKKSPAQMKLILIDPKQLELALYARLPHLIMPVITDAKTASISLLWAVQEMERRYSIMTEFGVRNIEGFNHKLKRADSNLISNIRKFYEYEVDETYELPYIVIIVDEFADLILTQSGKDIEKNICRLAAKARAAGIHLVIATQRPSVDVITGLIKSNFPTRVSFRVTSAVDSRTILNAMGAEKLLGKGDMLYKYGVDTTRIHSSYIEEEEIEMLTSKLAELAPQFNEHVMEFLANGGEESSESVTISSKENENGGKDEKYDEAVRVVIEHRSASASLLQRRLGVGYNRAANLIEEMEANGVVGPAQGAKPRKVLLGSDVMA